MKKFIVIFTGFLFIFGLSTVSMAEPFQNGSFEDRIPADDIGAFITLYENNEEITGWKVSSGSIDLIGTHWVASDGDRSIDLNGGGPGAISQVFDTVPDAVYHVLFDMAGNPDDPDNPDPDLKVLVASANSETAEYVFDSASATRNAMGWTGKSFVFMASSDSTTLMFASNSPDSPYGPALDNVRVFRTFPEDKEHPTGAVHAYDNVLWPPNNKKVEVILKGYVMDELSMARDGYGIGVSRAYLLVDGKKYVLKREGKRGKLDPDNGSFKIKVYLKAKKNAVYKIKLFAADTAIDEDGHSNAGLVDKTTVRVPHDMSGKDKDKKKKKPKKKK